MEKKCRDLERQLQEEKALRLKAETKVKQLRIQVRELTIATNSEESTNHDTIGSQDSNAISIQEPLDIQKKTTDLQNGESSCVLSPKSRNDKSISDSLDKCFGDSQPNTAIEVPEIVKSLRPKSPTRINVHASSSNEGDVPKVTMSSHPLRNDIVIQEYSSDEDNSSRSRHMSRDFDPLFKDGGSSESSPILVPNKTSIIQTSNHIQPPFPMTSAISQNQLQSSLLHQQSPQIQSAHIISNQAQAANSIMIQQSVTLPSSQSQTQLQNATLQHGTQMLPLPLHQGGQQQYQGQILGNTQLVGQPYLPQQQQIQQQYHGDPFDVLAMRQVSKGSNTQHTGSMQNGMSNAASQI